MKTKEEIEREIDILIERANDSPNHQKKSLYILQINWLYWVLGDIE